MIAPLYVLQFRFLLYPDPDHGPGIMTPLVYAFTPQIIFGPKPHREYKRTVKFRPFQEGQFAMHWTWWLSVEES